jgi:hypothetical protein
MKLIVFLEKLKALITQSPSCSFEIHFFMALRNSDLKSLRILSQNWYNTSV